MHLVHFSAFPPSVVSQERSSLGRESRSVEGSARGTLPNGRRCWGMQDPARTKPKEYRAQDVRQGEIILRRPWQRWVFAIGLAGGVILAVLLSFFGNPS